MFEKVNPCHPDKLADRIAGALVDLAYAKSENPKIAVEVLIGHLNRQHSTTTDRKDCLILGGLFSLHHKGR